MSKVELMQEVWAESFVTDDSLVQCLIEIRRALGDDSHHYIKTVPKRGYVFLAEVVERDVAEHELLLYTEEIEGVQLAIEETAEEPITTNAELLPAAHESFSTSPHSTIGLRRSKGPSRPLTIILASTIVALTAVGILVYRRRAPAEVPHAPIRSVAVLPLRNLTADPANEYFSDGLTESLITALSKISDLKVISRGSVFGFKGKEIDPREVGRQLNVGAVLEGSVRKGPDSLRVTVRLVSVEDGRVLWVRDTYDRALGDIFALQDEIARSIATGLRVQLSGANEQQVARRHTSNVEAYEQYLKGRFFWNKRTEEGLKKAIAYFEHAVALDPNYALAHVGLADCYSLMNLYSAQQQTDAFPKARAAAEKALQLDESLAEAHTALAYVKEQYDWDWSGAEREFNRAIELDPNYATAHQYYSEFLALRGRTEESVRHMKLAHELDPLSLIINTGLGYPYLCARRCDEALEEFRRALEIDQNFPPAIYYTARCHEQQSRFEQAIAEYRKAIALSGGSSLMTAKLGYAYAVSHREKEARTVLNELRQQSKERYISPFLIASVHAGLGEKKEALDWLEGAYKERDGLLVLLNVDSQLDGLRAEPQFSDLLARVGFVSHPSPAGQQAQH